MSQHRWVLTFLPPFRKHRQNQLRPRSRQKAGHFVACQAPAVGLRLQAGAAMGAMSNLQVRLAGETCLSLFVHLTATDFKAAGGAWSKESAQAPKVLSWLHADASRTQQLMIDRRARDGSSFCLARLPCEAASAQAQQVLSHAGKAAGDVYHKEYLHAFAKNYEHG